MANGGDLYLSGTTVGSPFVYIGANTPSSVVVDGDISGQYLTVDADVVGFFFLSMFLICVCGIFCAVVARSEQVVSGCGCVCSGRKGRGASLFRC